MRDGVILARRSTLSLYALYANAAVVPGALGLGLALVAVVLFLVFYTVTVLTQCENI